MTKLNGIRQALSTKYLERNEVIDGMLVALLSGESLLMIGPPGTAKSMMAGDVANAVSGEYFAWMLTKFTVPEELFGPPSLKGLEQDRYTRNMKGKMPTAHVVFFDEVGKASSAISNSCLTAMNERIIYDDGKAIPIPMITFFGASNEVPNGEELGAFYSRFILRYFVNPVQATASVEKLFKGLSKVSIPKLTLKELEAEQQIAAQLPISDDVYQLLVAIHRAVAAEGITVADRTWVKSVGVVRAFAHLNGHSEVLADDLEILIHLLWSTPDQIQGLRKVVNKIINPMNEKILQIMDSVHALPKDFSDEQAVEIYKKIGHAIKELKKLGDPAKNAKLAKALEDADAKRKLVADRALAD